MLCFSRSGAQNLLGWVHIWIAVVILQYVDSECLLNVIAIAYSPFRSQEKQVQLRFEISMQDNLESCKISAKLLEEAQLKGDALPLRAFYFAVATALKQVQ